MMWMSIPCFFCQTQIFKTMMVGMKVIIAMIIIVMMNDLAKKSQA